MESALGRLSLLPAGDIIREQSSLLRQLPVIGQSVRHWQKGTSQVLSVIRRRDLATVADCGISMCLPLHFLATRSNVLL